MLVAMWERGTDVVGLGKTQVRIVWASTDIVPLLCRAHRWTCPRTDEPSAHPWHQL